MSEKFCDSCGTALVEGAKFCKNCGKVTASVSAPPSQQAYSNPAPPPQQPYYQAPPQQAYYPQRDTSPMTVGQYIVTFLLTAIPFAGFILLLVWAFDSSTNLNKRNYARAALIMALIGIGVYIVLFAIIGTFISSIISSMGGNYYY